MRALLLALVLAAPPAAAIGFVALSPGAGVGLPCGAGDACFDLQPGEAWVRIEGARAFVFLAPDGAPLASGTHCAGGLLPVPPGAASLRLTPGAC